MAVAIQADSSRSISQNSVSQINNTVDENIASISREVLVQTDRLQIINPQNTRVIVHLKQPPTFWNSFNAGASMTLGSLTVGVIAIGVCKAFWGAAQGSAKGAAIAGTPGALAGAVIGGAAGFIV